MERTTLIAVLVIPPAWAIMYPPFHTRESPAVRPALRVTRDSLRIDGNRGSVETIFPHADHQKRLGGDTSCVTCHHMSLPGDETTPCSRCHEHMVDSTLIFDHARHIAAVVKKEELGGVFPENYTCAICHAKGETKTAGTAKHCLECHKENTDWEAEYDESDTLTWAVSYMEAMHKNCMGCHEKEAEKADRPELPDCSTCHRSLTPRIPDGRQYRPESIRRTALR
jgi:hypothetical protein